MKKINSKKGLAALMTVVMGVSMFAVSGTGTTMGMFRSNNNSLDSQCNERSQAFGLIRDQRRQAIMGARRFGVGVIDVVSSFVPTFTRNAQEINDILSQFVQNEFVENDSINSFIIRTISSKLDELGFSSYTISNMVIIGRRNFLDSGMSTTEFLRFHQYRYTLYAEKIFNGELTCTEMKKQLFGEMSLYEYMLTHTFYKYEDGKFFERTLDEAKACFDDINNFCEYLYSVLLQNNN